MNRKGLFTDVLLGMVIIVMVVAGVFVVCNWGQLTS